MKRNYNQRVYGEIDREGEHSTGHYFLGDAGHGYGGDVNPPGFERYPDSWATLGPHAGRGPKGYKRSDERVEEDINERLTHNALIDATYIEVVVHAGEVTLQGTVDSRRTRRLVEELAESVSGVADVDNQLLVGEVGQRKATSAAG